MSESETIHSLRSLHDDVAQDVQQHLANLALFRAMTAGGRALPGIDAGMRHLAAQSQTHAIRLSSALEALEAGRTAEALQLLGADH